MLFHRRAVYTAISCLLLSACNAGWDEESQQLFRQGCLESAKESHMDVQAAESMCACRLEKVMKKYPQLSEAMEHMDSLANDPEIKACK